MQHSTKTRRIFRFDSGTHIEVFRHFGYDKWAACREKGYSVVQAYGPTKLAAVQALRKELAQKTTQKLTGDRDQLTVESLAKFAKKLSTNKMDDTIIDIFTRMK